MQKGGGKDKMRAMVFLEAAKSHYESFKLFFLHYLKEAKDENHDRIKNRVFYLDRQIKELYKKFSSNKGGVKNEES